MEDNLPFLLLRKANDSHVRVLSQLDKKYYNTPHDNMTCGVFSKFQSKDNQVFIYAEVDRSFRFKKSDLNESNLLNATSLIDLDEQNRYIKLVNKAVLKLKKSSLRKVVLSRKQTVSKRTSDLKILIALLNSYLGANCYFFHHPKVGKWMGATPEILVQIEDGKLKTMSLAGTAIFEENKIHIWGDKEKEEQELVTDFIIDKLANMGAYDIQKSDVHTVRAGSLIHLKTDIKANIHPQDRNNFIEALHPTPAVCGMPRNEARSFILENENYDRSFYTGYLGIVENHKASYFVNLRCMELHDQHVDIYVGGGITELSDPQAEFNETVNKLMTMKKLLK